MSFQDIPQEVVERILDEFRSIPRNKENQRTLLACTLVNQSFKTHARRLLVAHLKIIVNDPPIVAALTSSLSSTPSLVRYVRSLEIELGGRCFNEYERFIDNTRVVMAIFNLLLIHRANLKRLAIRFIPDCESSPDFDYDGRDVYFKKSVLQVCRSSCITTLDLASIRVGVSFLAHCSSLNELILHNSSFGHSLEDIAYAGIAVLAKLQVLDIRRGWAALWMFFEDPPETPGSKKIVFHNLIILRFTFGVMDTNYSEFELERLWEVLVNSGASQTLEELELTDRMFKCDAPVTIVNFDIGKLKRLRHFKLKGIVETYFNDYVRMHGAYPLLRKPSFTTVETIDIALEGPPGKWKPRKFIRFLEGQDKTSWWKLVRYFCDDFYYPRLQSVNFSLHVKPRRSQKVSVDDISRLIRHKLHLSRLEKQRSIIPNVIVTVEAP